MWHLKEGKKRAENTERGFFPPQIQAPCLSLLFSKHFSNFKFC